MDSGGDRQPPAAFPAGALPWGASPQQSGMQQQQAGMQLMQTGWPAGLPYGAAQHTGLLPQLSSAAPLAGLWAPPPGGSQSS